MKRHWVCLQLRFEAPKDVKLEMLSRPAALSGNTSLICHLLPLDHMRGRFWSRYSVCLSVCPSVRPSVCLSHAWIVTNLNGALHIFWYRTKGQSLCNHSDSGWWATLPSLWNLRWKWPTPCEKRRLRQISAYNVSTVRDSEKSLIKLMTNIKSTTRFPTSYRWSA